MLLFLAHRYIIVYVYTTIKNIHCTSHI